LLKSNKRMIGLLSSRTMGIYRKTEHNQNDTASCKLENRLTLIQTVFKKRFI